MPTANRHIDPAGDDAWLLEHTDVSAETLG